MSTDDTDREINFNASPGDIELCRRIAERVSEIAAQQRVMCDAKVMMMDVLNLHCNGTPLALLQLLMSDPTDFMEDINGIIRWIDRRNGGLLPGAPWSPRFKRAAPLH